MKPLLTLITLGLALALGSAMAADAPAKKLTPQQEKMANCNKEASGKTGDGRKAFMKTCLSAKTGDAATDKKLAQQEKMKSCNKDAGAKKLKGNERQTFMKECLSA